MMAEGAEVQMDQTVNGGWGGPEGILRPDRALTTRPCSHADPAGGERDRGAAAFRSGRGPRCPHYDRVGRALGDTERDRIRIGSETWP
jgi:hypothetical protein